MESLLEVNDLVVTARSGGRSIELIDRVDLRVGRGEIVGLVGESGSGKSTTSAAIIDLFNSDSVRRSGGSIVLDGEHLEKLSPRRMAKVRGRRIAMVFQDPSAYLDPTMAVGAQVAEALPRGTDRDARRTRVVELLTLMGLPDPAELAKRYPHELSGGQRQRVLIAAALAAEPDLLIADEPSTALDVTVQAQILALLRELRDKLGLAILFITHDLGVVAEMCDRVYVMYAGQVVEERGIESLFTDPRHPYTVGLLNSSLGEEARVEELFSIPGRVPDPRAMPSGCRFAPRCPLATEECTQEPVMVEVTDGRSACWHTDLVSRSIWEDQHV